MVTCSNMSSPITHWSWKKRKTVFKTTFCMRSCTEQALQVPVQAVQWNCIVCLCIRLTLASWSLEVLLNEFLYAFACMQCGLLPFLKNTIKTLFLVFLETYFMFFFLPSPTSGPRWGWSIKTTLAQRRVSGILRPFIPVFTIRMYFRSLQFK